MSENLQNIEKAKNFVKKAERLAKKYKDKDMTSSERNDAVQEVAIFNEQLNNFSIGFGEHFTSEIKSEMNGLIHGIKKLSAQVSANIEENRPNSEYQ